MQDLASQFQAQNLDDFLYQDKIVKLFKIFIQKNNIPNCIFYGSSGSGKTSFAKLVAKEAKLDFYEINGANFSSNEIRKIVQNYEFSLMKALIFIDEIHRLSKTQQDLLLPILDKKKIIIISASSQNPVFCLDKALISRLMIFEFEKIEDFSLIFNKISSKLSFTISDEAKAYLFKSSNYDLRAFFNLLHYALIIDNNITLQNLKLLRAKSLNESINDKELHYNLISAFIKSLRGSDIDASLYYLARMILAKQSQEFIAKKLVVFASEDIGNANPNALNIALNSLNAIKQIASSEAKIILAQATIYLASCPKSNSSYKAINKALAYVEQENDKSFPKHLINNSSDYLYPHDFKYYVKQKYKNNDEIFYESKAIAFEKTLDDWMKKIKN